MNAELWNNIWTAITVSKPSDSIVKSAIILPNMRSGIVGSVANPCEGNVAELLELGPIDEQGVAVPVHGLKALREVRNVRKATKTALGFMNPFQSLSNIHGALKC